MINAKQFYNRIRNKSKYKLVNGLFIVRYYGNGIYEFVGDFHKKGGYGATPSTSFVKLSKSRQLFDPKRKLSTTTLGRWTKLNIGFRMKPIGEILK